ncbi:MAG TPA: SRPBCC family protein [Mycobacterium sp.]|nr:SRPBCC family protein [Mycobacterium sp.]
MAKPLVVEQSRAIPVGQDDAFHGTLAASLPTLCRRWYGPIPPVKAVRDQTGDWMTVGETRTLKLAGGGSVREELLRIETPRSYGYRLTNIKGPMAALVDHVDGEWVFSPAGTGTKVTWRWTLHPRSALSVPGLRAFGRLWRGYARLTLEELSNQLVR